MSLHHVNELVALRVMGWALSNEPKSVSACVRYERPGMDNLPTGDWSPTHDLNDARLALEKAANTSDYSIYCFADAERPYVVEIDDDKRPQQDETLAFAMTRCALIASGVTDAEIDKAVRA